ncbi:high-affinity choline transporter 1-like [Limulus polyphemus]|uniref:Choline cotransporter n=1 Tax=Limulus polyphemus TaxID=6850 RepID=Q9GPB1_LIMPO|nr:high-affinity choline transporter 1-like [Limulus polyphemus]AAG41055.1 choline cotransporter [Limulus polyphemus]
MAVNILGVVSIGIFYVIILIVGIWASRKKKTSSGQSETEEIMLAGRNIGFLVGVLTMTATWVGGGYINGTAEAMYNNGLVWCQAPFGYALSLFIGGIVFAKKMRSQGYVTMLDPLQENFGSKMGGLLFLPALCGEIFWSAAILAALGATISVITELESSTSIIVSSSIAVFYTFFGGFYSVAYTDVIQLFCIFFGLWLCIPFSFSHEAVGSLSSIDFLGSVKLSDAGINVDIWLLLIFGGIPWQVYFQRVLSAKNVSNAQVLSYVAAVGCVVMAIPAILIGVIAKATAWNETALGMPLTPNDTSLVLPLVLHYLTPTAVSFFGLGAVSAAVMSSSDSSILSASSLFSRNVYKLIFRQKASEREVVWVIRISILVVGILATAMALTVKSVYGLWYLSSDLIYVILFPQLLCVVHLKKYCNTYGSLSAYIVGFLLRALGGESILGLEPVIHYPFFSETSGQRFPFRTLSMLASLITLLAISGITKWIFEMNHLPAKLDIFRCVTNIQENIIKIQKLQGGAMPVLDSIKKEIYQKDMNNSFNTVVNSGNAELLTDSTYSGKIKKNNSSTQERKYGSVNDTVF